ncbi:MAG: GtrA family protein [Defluviitaleaceae bacterium]|nr:GtrA family protein [Defluviitaleaceae bacterium]
MKIRSNKPNEFIRFLVVGAGMTLFHFTLFVLLIEFFGVQYLLSNVAAYVVSVIISYYLTNYFTFQKSESKHRNQVKKFSAFFLMRLAVLLADSILLWLMVDIIFIDTYIARIVLTGFFLFITYGLSRLIFFRM